MELDYQEVCEWAEQWHVSFIMAKCNIVNLEKEFKI